MGEAGVNHELLASSTNTGGELSDYIHGTPSSSEHPSTMLMAANLIPVKKWTQQEKGQQ